jgi:hypothetical protein
MPKISIQQLQTYFAGAIDTSFIRTATDESIVALMQSGNRHPIYAETVLQYQPLKIHADGDFPQGMISARRPSESDEILRYRKDTYKAITKLPVSKVLTCLSKIRRSPDWMIQFSDDKIPAAILAEESLEKYLSGGIPSYKNITDWIFGMLLKQNAIDANAVIAVIPVANVADETEYFRPVPIIFNSDFVLEYNEKQQFSILQSRKKVNIALDGGSVNYSSGFRFYYIDDKEVVIYDQTKDGYSAVFTIKHKLGKMPVFKVKGEAFKSYDDLVVNKSRLDAMVPFLDEAACEYSDLKGSKIQHLFPLFWYYQNKECTKCTAGKITTDAGPKECGECGGSGKVKFSPFAHLQLNPPAIGESSVPSPPAGYITKDTEILKLQEASVDKNNAKALAAINMQFLDQTPLTISGEAKNVDREELNNFVYNFAEDLIATADQTIYWINEWRYVDVVPDPVIRRSMLPSIPVPQNFDLLPTSYLMEEITKARTQKVNPFLLAMMETQLAQKKFYNSPKLAEVIELYFSLDPLPAVSTDEKMTMLQNKGITLQDFVVSCNLPQFIKQAMEKDEEFCEKEHEDQMQAMYDLADKKIEQSDAAAQMMDAAKQKIIEEQLKQSGGAGA